MKKVQFQAQTIDGTLSLAAYDVGVPGLVVHHEIANAERRELDPYHWAVSHVKSGKQIPAYDWFDLRKQAAAYAREIAGVTDWTQADEEIGAEMQNYPDGGRWASKRLRDAFFKVMGF